MDTTTQTNNIDTITLSGGTDTLTITATPTLWDMSTSYNSDMIFTNCAGAPTITIGSTAEELTFADHGRNSTVSAAQITLEGDGADITINGQSLSQTLARLEERLNILNVNPELESEWSELRELGERYRSLEAHIEAKMQTYRALERYDAT